MISPCFTEGDTFNLQATTICSSQSYYGAPKAYRIKDSSGSFVALETFT